jgi:DNA-binding IclR family transcriptional regulator
VIQHATRAGTQAVERAFAVLRSFTDQQRVWALADLSRKLGLARPTTLRLLGALEREGMVQRTIPATSYRLGPRAIQLSALAQRSNELPIAARAQLEDLARRTGETASLEVLTDHEIMVLAEVRGRFRGSASERVGARWPAHAAATGKVLLSAALKEDGETWGRFVASARRFPRYTEHTITTLSRFRAALARVTRDDYAVAVKSWRAMRRSDAGVGLRWAVVAALCLGWPATRLSTARLPALIRRVREAAKRVSQQLGNPDS